MQSDKTLRSESKEVKFSPKTVSYIFSALFFISFHHPFIHLQANVIIQIKGKLKIFCKEGNSHQ